MNGERLDEASKRFHDDAWLAALQGYCANPKHPFKSTKDLARCAEEVAHDAEELFRKMNGDVAPHALAVPPDPATPAKVQKASKKHRA